MERTNRQELTDYGWIHIQDNSKVLRTDGKKDQLIAQERGEFGEQWWSKNSSAWEKVRASWDKIYTKNRILK